MSSTTEIEYSDVYSDDTYDYRHVILPRDKAKLLPYPMRILEENVWRGLGVQQSKGWEHWTIFPPEPHVLIFRRPKKKEA